MLLSLVLTALAAFSSVAAGGCGGLNKSYAPFILGGSDAKRGEFPFMAAIRTNKVNGIHSFICSATILTRKWLITYSRCISKADMKNTFINVGSNNMFCGKSYRIQDVIYHPELDQKNFFNEIVLIKLKKSLVFSDFVKNIALPTPNWDIINGTQGVIAGWGRIIRDNPYSLSVWMQKGVNFQALSHTECLSRKPNFDVNKRQFCVAGQSLNHTAFIGDGGGPFIYNRIQLGIFMGVISRTSRGQLTYFIRLPSYIDWIKKALGPDSAYLDIWEPCVCN